MKTIVAISTPIGRGGIGIVRMSGDDAKNIASQIFFKKGLTFSALVPNVMYFGTVSGRDFSDRCYMVWFRAPKTYTGEDVVEFQCHGGVKLTELVVNECILRGAEMAAPGEFTKRAFLNGKMALSDAEGVIDLINADSEAGVNAAYRLMTGKLAGEIGEIQKTIFDVICDLEAVLDYPEELEDENIPQGKIGLDAALKKLAPLAKSESYGKMAKYGINVVMCGDTNVGKSSLMNAMLKENRAIVTPVAGTTRDLIGESFLHGGVKINLTDTAGIRESADEIEKEGIKRAKNAVLSADLVLYVKDGTEFGKEMEIPAEAQGKRLVTVINKGDLLGEGVRYGEQKEAKEKTFVVSAKNGDGVEELLDYIVSVFNEGKVLGTEVITEKRHLSAVLKAKKHLEDALENYDALPSDCILVDVKAAWQALGEITGSTSSEEVVNAIFDKFCVGK